MNIVELKTKCNEAYDEAIRLMENAGDRDDIRKALVTAAELLVKIGSLSASEKSKCEQKARKLLDVIKSLREFKSIDKIYFDLTGKQLPPITQPKHSAPLPNQKRDGFMERAKKAAESKTEAPSMSKPLPRTVDTNKGGNFQFQWDKLPSISFEDVAGLDDVKDAVNRKVLMPLENPELYEGYIKKNGGGLLLYGPPGTGKTMIAAAIAREIGAKFCSIGAADLVLNGIGNSEKAITALFNEARSFSCAIIFFDEIDAICPKRTNAQHAKQIRSELLRQMQGLDSYGKDDGKILFLIAATNKPWEMDTAFLRPGRLGTRIYVGLPDTSAREYMIRDRLSKIESMGKVGVFPDIDIFEIVEKTEGFNGADMGNLLDEVQEISIARTTQTGNKIITNDDFIMALEKVTTSVQKEDLKKLEEWRTENG